MDCLSRLISKTAETFEDTVIAVLRAENILCNGIRGLSVTLPDTKSILKNEKFFIKIETLKAKENNRSARHKCKPSLNMLIYAQRVEVPAAVQKHLLKEFHFDQPAISRMKSLMRSYIYWPIMECDIEVAVKSCRACALQSSHCWQNYKRDRKPTV